MSQLAQLPFELQNLIFQNCSLVELATLSRSCRALRSTIGSLDAWQPIREQNYLRLTPMGYVAKHVKLICLNCKSTTMRAKTAKKVYPVYIGSLQQEQPMCFERRINHYKTHTDDNVPGFLKSGLVLLSDAKKYYKLDDGDLVSLTIAQQSISHHYRTTITHCNREDVAKKAIELYGGLFTLSSISKYIKEGCTRVVKVYVSKISTSITTAQKNLENLFNTIGCVKTITVFVNIAAVELETMRCLDIILKLSNHFYINDRKLHVREFVGRGKLHHNQLFESLRSNHNQHPHLVALKNKRRRYCKNKN